jgi:hypothetical protein
MDELVDRIVANVGVDRKVAEKAVGIILNFLSKEGPADKVPTLLEKLPGADAAIAAASAKSGGIFSGMGGVMGVGSELMAAGLGMGEIQDVAREILGYAREKAGDEAINSVVAAIPGLSQYV